MAKFRKKPVVIEAAQASVLIHCAKCDWQNMPAWFRDAYEKGGLVITDRTIMIKTLEGDMQADYDDFVICGVKGELYPCKSDIFAATYEAVQE